MHRILSNIELCFTFRKTHFSWLPLVQNYLVSNDSICVILLFIAIKSFRPTLCSMGLGKFLE